MSKLVLNVIVMCFQEFIKRFPRTIKDSMRQEESSRKKKRIELKERKEKEKEKKKEEIKQLKAMKRKEIMDKLSKLKKIAGKLIPYYSCRIVALCVRF
jgi:hypothetical protein